MRWFVSQIGARQHYGIARGFHAAAQLGLMYTDVWVARGRSLLARGPAPLRAMASRYHADVPPDRVVAFNARGLWDALAHRRAARGSVVEVHREYLRLGRWFASTVAADLARRRVDPAADAFFGFNTGCLETFAIARDRGLVTVCDQIDPGQVEDQIVRAEADRWPGWQRSPGIVPDEYWQRMRDEWTAADRVLVNSDWSRDALVHQGVPAKKLFVVPVAFEPDGPPPPQRLPTSGPLTVLWLGTVNLRKGIPYLLDAARLLLGEPVQFIVAGPVAISDTAVATAPLNVRFVGRVTRDQTANLYRSADLFVLPTVSDGFAITQLEAMSHGLPVIATPHCGQVVTPGVDGQIVPARDSAALATTIAQLIADRAALREMGRRAIDTSRQFGLGLQTERCNAAVAAVRAGHSPTKDTNEHEEERGTVARVSKP